MSCLAEKGETLMRCLSSLPTYRANLTYREPHSTRGTWTLPDRDAAAQLRDAITAHTS